MLAALAGERAVDVGTRAAAWLGLSAFPADRPSVVLILGGRVKVDVAIIQVSPPDKHGLCTLENAAEVLRFENLVAPAGRLPVNAPRVPNV